jgi:transmembrane sensor
MDSSIRIEERAAAWLAQRDSGRWTAEDERALEEWLHASTAHEVAFIRLEASWNEALRLKALGAGAERGTLPSPDEWQLSPFFDSGAREDAEQEPAASARAAGSAAAMSNFQRMPGRSASPARPRSRYRLVALAACICIALAAALTWYVRTNAATYRTAVGGFASVPMNDGSKVILNTDSAIRLAVSETERQVRLDRGEAFFEVAKDPHRPFVVTAGSTRVTAVGTRFSVRRTDSGGVRVFVTEGKVRVEDASFTGVAPARLPEATQASASDAIPMAEVLVAAGGIARTVDDGVLVQENALPEVEDYLSWRSGFLVFREASLAEAVAEFNRYNERKLVIQDATLADIQLSGKFRATNFGAFVRLLEEGFGVRTRVSDEGIVLTDGHSAASGPGF